MAKTRKKAERRVKKVDAAGGGENFCAYAREKIQENIPEEKFMPNQIKTDE